MKAQITSNSEITQAEIALVIKSLYESIEKLNVNINSIDLDLHFVDKYGRPCDLTNKDGTPITRTFSFSEVKIPELKEQSHA